MQLPGDSVRVEENCSAGADETSLVHQIGKKKLTIEELEQLATKNNPTFSKERNSYGGFTTKSFNTLKINQQSTSQNSDTVSKTS